MFPLQYTLSFENWLLFSPIKDNHESRLREESLQTSRTMKFASFILRPQYQQTIEHIYLHAHSLDMQSAPFTLRKCPVVPLTKIRVNLSFYLHGSALCLLVSHLIAGVTLAYLCQ